MHTGGGATKPHKNPHKAESSENETQLSEGLEKFRDAVTAEYGGAAQAFDKLSQDGQIGRKVSVWRDFSVPVCCGLYDTKYCTAYHRS